MKVENFKWEKNLTMLLNLKMIDYYLDLENIASQILIQVKL